MKIILSSIYPYAFLVLLMIVPFDEYMRALPNILLIILVLAFPFTVTKADFKKLKNPAVATVLFFVVYLLLNSLFFERLEENFTILKKIFISIGLVILYLPVHDFKKINKAIIFSALAAVLYSLYHIVVLVKNTGTFEFGNSSNPLETLLIDRLYLGLLCVLSILVSYTSMTKRFKAENKYHLANIIINVLFVFLIVSRIAIITLIVLTVLKLFYNKKQKLNTIIVLGLLTITTILAFAFNDNLEKRFFYSTPENTQQSLLEKTMKWEPRTIIWDCTYHIAKEESSFFKGLGFEGAKDKLVGCYSWNIKNESRKEWFLFKKFNSHNQFFDFYLSTGILSALLFILLFIILFFRNRKDFFSTAMLLTIFLFAFVESFFHRQIGAYYFGVILIYLLLNTNNLRRTTETNNALS